jgi:hypothetical protein
MERNKMQSTKKQNPEWIVELADGLIAKDITNLSDYQKKMLRDQYLDFLRDGLQPKEAIEKALEIVLCFN